MSRGRLVVVWSSVVVAAGLSAALGALVLDPAREALGPLPPEGAALLPEARFIMGLDVQRFSASPFYKRYANRGGRPDAFAELQAKTGIDPERDVDHVFVAGGARMGQRAAALVVGRFDRSRIARAIETGKRGVTWKKAHGTNVYLFGETSKSPGALAFLDDSSIVLGAQSGVEAAVANHSAGRAAASNAPLAALLKGVRPGSTFWLAGDRSVLANLPTALPATGGTGGGAALSLPALQSVVVTGDLDPQVSLSVTGDTTDAAAAKNIADIVRGFVALASLQAGQKPELARLASAVSITTEASRVHVDARIPYELLDALAPSPPAPPAQ
jgi:hypothetical protein